MLGLPSYIVQLRRGGQREPNLEKKKNATQIRRSVAVCSGVWFLTLFQLRSMIVSSVLFLIVRDQTTSWSFALPVPTNQWNSDRFRLQSIHPHWSSWPHLGKDSACLAQFFLWPIKSVSFQPQNRSCRGATQAILLPIKTWPPRTDCISVAIVTLSYQCRNFSTKIR